MKIVAVSDQHGRLPRIPECDVLLIAGDICPDFWRMPDPDLMRMRQMEWLRTEYVKWEQTLLAKHILATPGNHDWIKEMPSECRTRLFIDEGCEIDGKQFYFTPWIPPIMRWNYMLPRGKRKEVFAKIPEGLDVLVSHSPAFGVMDRNYDGEHCGCEELRQAIYRAKPKYMVHGHIHEGGREMGSRVALGPTIVYNVAMFGSLGMPEWQPIIFDLP